VLAYVPYGELTRLGLSEEHQTAARLRKPNDIGINATTNSKTASATPINNTAQNLNNNFSYHLYLVVV
jgi:hypothetical protein